MSDAVFQSLVKYEVNKYKNADVIQPDVINGTSFPLFSVSVISIGSVIETLTLKWITTSKQ